LTPHRGSYRPLGTSTLALPRPPGLHLAAADELVDDVGEVAEMFLLNQGVSQQMEHSLQFALHVGFFHPKLVDTATRRKDAGGQRLRQRYHRIQQGATVVGISPLHHSCPSEIANVKLPLSPRLVREIPGHGDVLFVKQFSNVEIFLLQYIMVQGKQRLRYTGESRLAEGLTSSLTPSS
jgi:hypothetical protein